MVMIVSFACVPAIEDKGPETGGGAAVRAAGGEAGSAARAAAEEPILLRQNKQTRVRSTLRIAAKLEGPPALYSRFAARHAGPCRDEPSTLTAVEPPVNPSDSSTSRLSKCRWNLIECRSPAAEFTAMKQGRSVVIILVALAIGFAAGFVVRPIVGPAATGLAAPRATQYFAAHLDQARETVAGCRDGTVRGDECAHAEEAITAAEARNSIKAFLGTQPH